jgi:hypothetical protein
VALVPQPPTHPPGSAPEPQRASGFDAPPIQVQAGELPNRFDPAANANAELSTKLNYMLCVSHFAHYLKVMARDKIGSFMEVNDCERWLNQWIENYATTVFAHPRVARHIEHVTQPALPQLRPQGAHPTELVVIR